jgi:hypothetical protein
MDQCKGPKSAQIVSEIDLIACLHSNRKADPRHHNRTDECFRHLAYSVMSNFLQMPMCPNFHKGILFRPEAASKRIRPIYAP